MKKLLIIVCFVLSVVSCNNPNIIVEEDMVVTSVRIVTEPLFQTRYKVQVSSLNKNAGHGTINGQYLMYYTNTLYTVGDTLTIANKRNK